MIDNVDLMTKTINCNRFDDSNNNNDNSNNGHNNNITNNNSNNNNSNNNNNNNNREQYGYISILQNICKISNSVIYLKGYYYHKIIKP